MGIEMRLGMALVGWMLTGLIGGSLFAQEMTLEEALDGEDLTWKTSEGSPWQGRTDEMAPVGGDSAHVTLTTRGDSWLETTVMGPGLLTFRWSREGDMDHFYDRFIFSVNSVPVDALPTESGWWKAETALGPGEHRLRWAVHQGGIDTVMQASLDAVSFSDDVPELPIALSDAIGMVHSSGHETWFSQSEEAYDGLSAFQSGEISSDEQSRLRVLTKVPGELHFKWKASTEPDSDSLSFATDADDWRHLPEPRYLSGDTGWEPVSVEVVSPGWNEWSFLRDSSVGGGSNRVWLDALEFTPRRTESLAEGLDLPVGTSVNGSWELSTAADSSFDGEDMVQSQLGEGNASLALAVAGPGVLRFWSRADAGSSRSVVEVRSFPWLVSRLHNSQFVDEWRLNEVLLPPGPSLATWYAISNSWSPESRVFVDEVSIERPIPLADALDTNLALTQGGDVPWLGISSENAAEDGDLAITGLLRGGQEAWIETSIDGPARLDFSWRGSFWTLKVDGESVFDGYWNSSSSDWTKQSAHIPPGTHTVSWHYVAEHSPHQLHYGTGWLDMIEVYPSEDLGLAEALDLSVSDTVVITDGTPPLAQQLVSQDGDDAVQFFDGSRLSLEYPQEGVLDFWFRDGSDWLDISANADGPSYHTGTEEDGPLTWKHYEVIIPAQGSVVRWWARGDHAFLDRVRFRGPISLEEALGSEYTFTSGGAFPWVGFPTSVAPGGNAVRLKHPDLHLFNVETVDVGWIETQVEGPGTLHYWASSTGGIYDSYDHKTGESEVIETGLIVKVDGAHLATHNIPSRKCFTHRLSPGTHTVRWELVRHFQDAAHGAWLAGVGVDQSTPTFAEALDLETEQMIQTSGTIPWDVGLLEDAEDGSALRLNIQSSYNTGILSIPTTGPKLIEFDWRALPQGTLEVNEFGKSWPNQLYRYHDNADDNDWHLASVYLPEGAEGVAVSNVRSSIKSEWWFDRLRLSDPVSLAEAADTVHELTSGGVVKPVGLSSRGASDGADHIAFLGEGASWVEVEVEGPGTLHFHLCDAWKRVRMTVDGEEILEARYARQGEQHSVTLGEGAHQVRWEAAGHHDQPYAFLDQLWFEGDLLTDVLDWNGEAPVRITGDWRLSSPEDAGQDDSALTFEIPAEAERLYRSHELNLGVSNSSSLSFLVRSRPMQNIASSVVFNDVAGSSQVISMAEDGWKANAIPIPAGATRATLRFAGENRGLQIWLNEVTLDPFVSLEEALDGALTFTNGGTSPWQTVTSVESRSGNSMGQTLFGYGSGEALLETEIEGPGVLAFSWRADAQVSASWSLNGETMFSPPGAFDYLWERVEHTVGPGTHTIRWMASSRTAESGEVMLDAITFTEDYLNEVLDSDSLAIGSRHAIGVAIVQGEEAYDGEDAVKLPVSDRSIGRLTIPVAGDGEESLVSLWTRASILGIDLEFNQGWPNRIGESITTHWQEHQFLLGPDQDATFLIAKSYSSGTEGDYVLIDELTVTPASDDIRLPLAMEASALVFKTSETKPWRGRSFSTESELVEFAQAAVDSTEADPSWMETTVSGPGMASFRWKGDGVGMLEIGDGSVYQMPNTPSWRTVQIPVSEGDHTLRWSFHSVAGSLLDQLGGVDSFQFHQEQSPLHLGLGLPPDARVSWQGASQVAVQESLEGTPEYLRVSDGELHWRNLAGPGSVAYRFRLGEGTKVRVLLDGTIMQTHEGPLDWTLSDLSFPAGIHTLTWKVERDHATTEVAMADFEGFSYRPALGINAVDGVSQLLLVTGGEAPWHAEETLDAPSGPNRLVSGSLAPGEESWVEATVNGPGQIDFWWRLSDLHHDFTCTLNGEVILSEKSGRDWGCWQYPIPEGEHTLRWAYQKPSWSSLEDDVAWIDGIVFHEGHVPLREAIEFSEIAKAAGASCWRSDSVTSYDGDDSLVTGPHDHENSSSALTTQEIDLAKRTVLSYRKKLEAGTNGNLVVSADKDEGLTAHTDADGWQQLRRVLRPGPQTFEWKYTVDRNSQFPPGRVWLDAIELTPVPEVSLTEALEAESVPGLSWSTSAESPWFGEALETTFDGVDQAASGRGGHPEESWLEASIEGPGDFHFLWRRGPSGIAKLTIDGEVADARHAPDLYGWKEVRLLLPAGPHTIRWTSNYETIFLDRFGFVPASEGLCQALDFIPQRGFVALSGEPGMLRSQDVMTSDGQDAVETQGDVDLSMSQLGSGHLSVLVRSSGSLANNQRSASLSLASQHDRLSRHGVWRPLSVSVEDETDVALLRIVNDTSPEAYMWLDQLSMRESPGPTMAEAFDTNLPLEVSETAGWVPSYDQGAFDKLDALKGSGHHSTTHRWIEVSVTGPGTIGFAYEGRVYWEVNGIPFVDFSGSSLYEEFPEGWHQAEIGVPPGEFTVRWIPFEANVKLDRLTFIPGTGSLALVDWLAMHDLEGPKALPDADPNGDGISNRVAWAFGISPNRAVLEDSLPVQAVESTSFGDCLVIDYFRRTDEAGRYRAQFSDDLKQWSSEYAEESVHDLGNGWQRVRVRDRIPVAGPGTRFGQVEISGDE